MRALYISLIAIILSVHNPTGLKKASVLLNTDARIVRSLRAMRSKRSVSDYGHPALKSVIKAETSKKLVLPSPL
jgi:hypothetical protein